MKLKATHLPSLPQVVEKFVFPRATTSVEHVKSGKTSGQVILNGWLDRKPKQLAKGLVFARLRDPQGNIIQLVDRSVPNKLKSLSPDSIISVEGSAVSKIQDGATTTEFDLDVSHVQVLNSANLLSGQLAKDTKNWPPEYRYIQLRQEESQRILRKRSKIISRCREILEDQEFVHVETPLLFKSTPEGAREFLVPTRKRGVMYALPQSPQQYKQLLIASGIDRYYQIAKCFRDEDLRQDRQPEFTQLDLEMAFANATDVKKTVEAVVKPIWEEFGPSKLATIDASRIVPAKGELGTLAYSEALAKYGIDKPDLRYSHEIKTLPATSHRDPDFAVSEALVVKGAADFFSTLDDSAKYKSRKPLIVTIGEGTNLREEFEKIATAHNWEEILATLGPLESGDIVAFSDRQGLPFSYENPTPLGRLRQILIEEFPHLYRRTDDSVALWVERFPLFEPTDNGDGDAYPKFDHNTIKSTHHPFTMVAIEDYENLQTDPLSCHGQHFDLVIDGVEVGGGSTRVHDSELQMYIFNKILGIEQPQKLFGHLLEALATGCPPHAGLAIGLDRFVAMLCGERSIRKTIAFPKTINGSDPMIGSPSKVTPKQLEPYHVRAV